jgi:hypothetical protein
LDLNRQPPTPFQAKRPDIRRPFVIFALDMPEKTYVLIR